ncbi:Transposase [Lentzea jiangxiensis]|uniref:Transposase n=1 Tax=Lentzea jiangxiensis TaxID=641025 RepID=A0A1H0SP78_9PSEU|nr:Transposase [Lentzea jiangxiensis]
MRKGEQLPWIVSDELWARIEPLLPVVPRRADHPGRKRLDDRKVLCGILFVLHIGIPWEFLPQKLGFSFGMTAWRRLRDWHQAGVAAAAREPALRAQRRGRAGLVAGRDRRLAHPRPQRRPKTGASPVDRARTGAKHHLITEGHGIPLAVSLTGGNCNDVTQLCR